MNLATVLFAAGALVCPQTSTPTSWDDATLDSGTPSKNGIVYDGGGAKLRLQGSAGVFKSTALGISDATVYAAVADFDRDTWEDFVGIGESSSFVRIYRNRTFDNPAPNWDDPNAVRTPKFVNVREIQSASYQSGNRTRPVAAADFSGDGWPDVFMATATLGSDPTEAKIWLNQASNDASGNPRFLASYNALASGTALSTIGAQTWGGTSTQAVDYNGDRKIDLLLGSGYNNGTVRVFLNQCTTAAGAQPAAPAPVRCGNNPTFAYSSTLITNMGYSNATYSGNLAMFYFEDVDADGKRDLISGAPSCCTTATQRLRLWKGVDGGGINAGSYQSITFAGAATTVFVADFSGDGKPDLIVGTDNFNYNGGSGGATRYWVNNGTGTPFTGSGAVITSPGSPTGDFDVGFVFNYDHDPSNTPDMMIADGNHSSSFYVFANRVVSQYVACGDVASGTIPLGALAGSETVVTAARIDPDYFLNSGTIKFFVSNEEPANWIQANDCGDGSGDLCASFPRPVGREVRWKVEMCSNAAHTRTPELYSVAMTFDYTRAKEYFRAGVTVNDGVAYLGGFRQPGDRGHFYAINAGLSTTYWDAATSIDGMSDSSRYIYTASAAGNARLDFTVANSSSAGLISVLGAANQSQAASVIAWVRSARFGVGNVGIPLSRLGAIETSTPAVLTKPAIPIWYTFASPGDRGRHNAFSQQNQDRRSLVFFGAKDGMIHAIETKPTAITTTPSGREAWAFVPPKTASRMIADQTTSLSTGSTQVSAYPDGSPTLTDYRMTNGQFATALISGAGNGGKSIVALDVTRTVHPTTGAIIGPTPLWTATPGDADAGQGHAKPAVARVLIGTAERYFVIAATGIAPDNPIAPWSKGRVVAAYDLATGELVWQFRAACPVTSDISVYETDDELEPGAPTFNGFMDRAIFADACGNVYKLDPGKDLDGAWNDNSTMGSILVDTISGARQTALFSTATSPGALGQASPITGTLAVRSDASTRVAIFFGTGGLESHPVTRQNEFYAVYADTGEIRSKLTGTCTSNTCEKFYGGVVVTPEQVILTRTRDPKIGTGTCDVGSTVVQALQLDEDANGDFDTDFTQALGSAVMGALYGDAGALYFATLSGDVSRIGTPRSPDAGGDTTSTTRPPQFGEGSESGTGTVGNADALALLGWRQVY
ncbi:MAG TPA: FG-GAP-like repeat-containing protein [Kofleriaceae bacterium]|nr:FG-GAP-like repeat-containing protein [Kofleriaceae bacterium]